MLSSTPIPVGNWSSVIHDLPSGHLPHVPILGNGYLGVALGTRNAPKGMPWAANESFNLWYNTNANWECRASGVQEPPARCAVRALGGLTIGSTAVLGGASQFEAEQRLEVGQLWSRRTGPKGATLTTLTYMHPIDNVAITEITFHIPNTTEGDAAQTAAASSTATAPRSCSICMDGIEAGQAARGLACGHSFHTACITRWLRTSRTCPDCRHSA